MPKDAKELLLRMVANDSGLTEVNLKKKSLGDVGAGAVAWALEGNTTATELHLDSNNIGDAGAECMAEMLKTNSTLTRLNLDNNNISDKGGQAFAEAIKVNSTLKMLVLESPNNRLRLDMDALTLSAMGVPDMDPHESYQGQQYPHVVSEELLRTIGALVATPGMRLICVLLFHV
jgi:hypothetical protein